MRWLAVDLGGSALEACLFADDNQVAAHARVDLRFGETPSGRSEANQARCWDAPKRPVAALADEAGSVSEIRAISACGFARTQVFSGLMRHRDAAAATRTLLGEAALTNG